MCHVVLVHPSDRYQVQNSSSKNSLIEQGIAVLSTLNGHGGVIDHGQISQEVIQDTHARHVLMYLDLLGFLDHLLHVDTLYLSGQKREDGELVKLDA